MTFSLKSFLIFSCLLVLIVSEVTLDTKVYILNQNLPGNNKVFTIQNASMDSGAFLTIAENTGADNQKFIISKEDGFYFIKAKHSGLYLTVTTDGTNNVIQTRKKTEIFASLNQQFFLAQRDFLSLPHYCFMSRSQGTFLQFDQDFDYVGGHWIFVTPFIKQALPTYGDPQTWLIKPVS